MVRRIKEELRPQIETTHSWAKHASDPFPTAASGEIDIALSKHKDEAAGDNKKDWGVFFGGPSKTRQAWMHSG